MVKQVMLVTLSLSVMTSAFTVRAQRGGQLGPPCLHSQSEQPNQKARRERAISVAQQINRAENTGPARRRYRSLDELPNVPPTPAGFRLQFNTDGTTYTFSLKDTLDFCEYAIFSDQDQAIYEATPRIGARLVPAETP